MFDYEHAKRFFADKLSADTAGRGRIESAAFHTANWIYQRGVSDGDTSLTARCLPYLSQLAYQHDKSPELRDLIREIEQITGEAKSGEIDFGTRFIG